MIDHDDEGTEAYKSAMARLSELKAKPAEQLTPEEKKEKLYGPTPSELSIQAPTCVTNNL